MRPMHAAIVGAAVLASHVAVAETSLTLTGVTDYDFRGISQTAGDPAPQVGIDWAGDLFYAGAWASTVDFKGTQTYPDHTSAPVRYDGNAELDLLAGLAGEVGAFSWDVGGIVYLYPGSDPDDGDPTNPDDDIADTEDYAEWYAGGDFAIGEVATAGAKAWFSPDLYDSGESAWYLEGNGSVNLPWELAVNLHVGYSTGDYFDLLSDDATANGSGDDADYIDYSVGIARSFGRFDFELKYVDTDTDDYFQVDKGVLRNDGRVILSVSTTLPWSDEAAAE